MSEFLALTRLAIARHRTPIVVLLAVLVAGEVMLAATLLLEFGSIAREASVLILVTTQVPVAMAALVLFDYGQQRDMMSPRGGCGEWLLLQPIASWKIAAVPAVLKTLWVCLVCALFSTTIPSLQIEGVGTPGPPVILSGSGTMLWLLAIGWRPVRHGWGRIAALAICLLLCYGSLVLALAVSQPSADRYYLPATLISIVVFTSGVGLLYDGVRLSRTHTLGLIPETGRAVASGERASLGQLWIRGPVTALIWNDLARTSGFIRFTLMLGVIPTVMIAILFVPLHAAAVGMLTLLFVYFGGIACSGIAGQRGQATALPSYIATQPLRTSTIAWTRMAVVLVVLLTYVANLAVVFLGWSAWESNRLIWMEWATDRAMSAAAPDDAIVLGVRWSIAIVLASTVWLCGRVIGYLWVGLVGRTWVQVVVTAMLSLAILSLFGSALIWFLRQTDWESTEASARGMLVYIPSIAAGLLLIKLACALAAVTSLLWCRLVTHRELATAIAIWSGLTLTLAASLAALLPDPRVNFVACLVASTLTIPLARVLLLPLAVSWDRHR